MQARPLCLEGNRAAVSSDDRSQKVALLIRNFFGEVSLWQDEVLKFTADILRSTPTTVVARWVATILNIEDDWNERCLPGMLISRDVLYEERTVALTWEDANDCSALSSDCLVECIQAEKDIEILLAWDDPRLDDASVQAALEHFDGGAVFEYFGSAEKVDFGVYPKRLRVPLRRLVIEYVKDIGAT